MRGTRKTAFFGMEYDAGRRGKGKAKYLISSPMLGVRRRGMIPAGWGWEEVLVKCLWQADQQDNYRIPCKIWEFRMKGTLGYFDWTSSDSETRAAWRWALRGA
jgi:hypothetical protein